MKNSSRRRLLQIALAGLGGLLGGLVSALLLSAAPDSWAVHLWAAALAGALAGQLLSGRSNDST